MWKVSYRKPQPLIAFLRKLLDSTDKLHSVIHSICLIEVILHTTCSPSKKPLATWHCSSICNNVECRKLKWRLNQFCEPFKSVPRSILLLEYKTFQLRTWKSIKDSDRGVRQITSEESKRMHAPSGIMKSLPCAWLEKKTKMI